MFTLQNTGDAPPQMLLDNPEFMLNMSTLLEKASQNWLDTHVPKKSLKMVTHQATPCRCPNTQWDPVHWTDQAPLQNVTTCHRRTIPHIGCQLFSRTTKAVVYVLCVDSSMTEPTINSTLYAFIEQVIFYGLQKMVLQFAICFVLTMVYTYMVYTLYNKTKHSVQSSNRHFTINQINSIASNNNRQLPEDQCTVN